MIPAIPKCWYSLIPCKKGYELQPAGLLFVQRSSSGWFPVSFILTPLSVCCKVQQGV